MKQQAISCKVELNRGKTLSLLCFTVLMPLVGMTILGPSASGQPYPNKPLRIVINGVGGGTEIIARLIAAGIAGPLGQNVIVDSRGITVVTADLVARAPPDGYT